MGRGIEINPEVPGLSARATGLNAAICGVTNDCTLLFAAGAVVGSGLAVTNVVGAAANDGTEIAITRAGVYAAHLFYQPETGGTVNELGMSLNTTVAARALDPAVGMVGFLAFNSCLLPAATEIGANLYATVLVTRALANAAGGAVLRFHAGDGGNATPAGGDVIEAECYYSVVLVANII